MIAEAKEPKIKIFGLKNIDKIIKGEIFCHVRSTKELIQFNPSITSGNQKCKGAIPNLVKRARLTIKLKPSEIKLPLYTKNTRDLKINTEEAIACTKKYLIAASLLFLLFSKLMIKGIKDIKFTSKPIHIPKREEEEIEIRVPRTKKKE